MILKSMCNSAPALPWLLRGYFIPSCAHTGKNWRLEPPFSKGGQGGFCERRFYLFERNLVLDGAAAVPGAGLGNHRMRRALGLARLRARPKHGGGWGDQGESFPRSFPLLQSRTQLSIGGRAVIQAWPCRPAAPRRFIYAASLQLVKPAFFISTHRAAARAAIHPSEAATTIWLAYFSLRSPIAKIPGMLVSHFSSVKT